MFTMSRPVYNDRMTTSARRHRLREATIGEIKAAALERIAEAGTGGLSIRGVAREIGMSPAGLYRYYDGLEALITDLITDAYDDLATACEEAIAEASTPRSQFLAAVMAYRQWAIRHPSRFLLVFGTPIPGYAAPPGGPTVAANQRVGNAFIGVAAKAWSLGEIRLPDSPDIPVASESAIADLEGVAGLPSGLIPVLLGTWAHFHGLVTLELLNQLDWIYPDATDFYSGEVSRMLDNLGVSRDDSNIGTVDRLRAN